MARKARLGLLLVLAMALVLGVSAAPAFAARPSIFVDSLQPTWELPVFSAYVGPPDYTWVSPGDTAIYDGREAGIIKAGLTPDTDGHYRDEGLFAFKPAIPIGAFAAKPLTYDVANEHGTNPVWMTIELDTGVVDDRSDNVTFQSVPAAYPAGWNTVDAGASTTWLQWADPMGTTTGAPMTLTEIAKLYPGRKVVRAYLRLGMGDSYHDNPNGTVAWVDKATIGGLTYDFVLSAAGEGGGN